MIEFMIRPGSFFLDEGDYLLIQEFGKKYGNYYSILASIASGRNTMLIFSPHLQAEVLEDR